MYKNFKNQGLIYIQDIIDKYGNIEHKCNLENKYACEFKPLQYEGLIAAIPKEWKKVIKGDNQCIHFILKHNTSIKIDKEHKIIDEISTKDMYWLLLNCIRPKSEKKWKDVCNIDFSTEDWAHIYTLPGTITKDTRILSLQYKITHRILACNDKLNTWKIKDKKTCNYCNEVDTIEHYLYSCDVTYTLWKYIFNWWSHATGISMPISRNEILFGLPNPNRDIVIKHYNYVILHGKYYINKCKQSNTDTCLYSFLLNVKNALIMKIESCDIANKEKTEIEWKDLLEIL